MKFPIALFLFVLTLTGCSLLDGGDDGPGKMTPEELRSAPMTVTVDRKQLTLETYMWRDFMPVSPPDGRGLIAVFRIVTADSSALPSGLTSDAAWVINGSRVWDTFFEDESPPVQLQHELERIARDGPKWEPQIKVEAVVRLRERDGTSHLLRAVEQTIHQTF